MKFFPNPQTLLEIGPVSIQWYAVLIITGAFVAYYFIAKELKRMGYSDEVSDDLFIGCLLCGILGARIWYVFFSDFGSYMQDPISIIKIWEGGLAIQGGLFGGLLFGYFYTKKRKFDFLRIVDAVIPFVLIGQAFGRWGNFVNKEAFGEKVTEAYFEHWPSFLNFIKEGMFINGSYREPMFFYESVLCIIGLVLIMLYKKYSKPKRGDLGYCYLLWYGAIRFWIEARRTDSLMFGGIKMAQLVSVAFIVVGLLGLLGFIRKLAKNKKPVLLFDLDGTVLDTEKIIFESYKHTFKHYKLSPIPSDEELVGVLGPTLQDTISKYLPNVDMDEAVEFYRSYNIENHKKYVKAFPNAKEYITKWKEEGYKIGIVSSKMKDVIMLGLDCCDMKDLFDVVLGVGEYSLEKPDKSGLIEACKQLNESKDNCIYVGDSVTDIEAAKNAGMYSIAYVSNKGKEQALIATKPNRVIYDLSEIDEILKEDISWTYNTR